MSHDIQILNGVACFAFAEAVRSAVWHGLGQALPGASFKVDAGLRAARAGFEVGTEKVFLADGREVPARAVLRLDSRDILAAVGPTWTPAQNRDATLRGLAPFFGIEPEVDSDGNVQPLTDSQLDEAARAIDLQSVGVLGEGRTVFAQTRTLRTLEISPRKRWEVKATVVNNHYARRVDVLASGNDVVCANTVRVATLAAEGEGTIERIRHGKGVARAIERAGNRLKGYLEALESLAQGAREALDTPLTSDEQLEVVRHLWDAKDREGQATHAALASQDRVLTLSKGVDLIGAEEHNPGSAYGLYAAITQYLDREAPRRFSATEKASKPLALAGTYLRSQLGLDPRAEKIREEATRVLLGVGAE